MSRLGITRVARQTGLDRIGIPVWCAYTPNARSIVIAQGKGPTDEIARTSAVMEAVERAVATEPTCITRRATLAALRAEGQAADPLDKLIASGARPIEPDEMIEWATARHIASGHPVLVPREAIDLDHARPDTRFWLSSDGLASGNTLEEAILHGLLERIERDALTLWDVTDPARRHLQRILPETIAAEAIRDLLRQIEPCGLNLSLHDITTDIGVACVAALLGPADLPPHGVRHVEVTLGAGAALDPAIAAERAITEAVQSRMTFIAGARDDLVAATFTSELAASTRQALEAPATRSFRDLPALTATTTATAIALLSEKLVARSVTDLYAIDLTPPWLPVHVAKVIVPDLEHPDGRRRQRFGMRALSRSMA